MACCADCARGAMGWIGSDIADAVGSAVSDVADVVVSLPGVDVLSEAVQDFARTAIGQVVTRAIATSLTGGLAPVLGPQLATVAWTLPGVLRGEPWDEAWLAEFNHRAESSATVLGGEVGKLFGEQIAAALTFIRERIPAGAIVEWSARQLADALGIRVDVAALAIDLVNRGWREASGAWDPATGERVPAFEAPMVIAPALRDVVRAALASGRATTVATSPIAHVSPDALRAAGLSVGRPDVPLISVPSAGGVRELGPVDTTPAPAGARTTAAPLTLAVGALAGAGLAFGVARALGGAPAIQAAAGVVGAAVGFIAGNRL